MIHIFGYISLGVWGTTSREKILCQWKELLRPGMCVCPLDSNVRSLVILTVFPNIWRLAGLGSDFTMQSPFGVIWQFVSSTAPLGFKGRCNDPHRKESLGVISGRSKTPRFWCLLPGLEVYGQNFSLQVSYSLHFPFLPSSFLSFFLSTDFS